MKQPSVDEQLVEIVHDGAAFLGCSVIRSSCHCISSLCIIFIILFGAQMVDRKSRTKDAVTREYTINLNKRLHKTNFKKKAPKAITEIRKFAQKTMGTKDVRVDVKLNKAVWSKVRGGCVLFERDGVVGWVMWLAVVEDCGQACVCTLLSTRTMWTHAAGCSSRS